MGGIAHKEVVLYRRDMESIEHLLGKIHNCDCLEFMKQLPDKCVDLVLTDPPYGVNMDKGFSGRGLCERRQYSDKWDSKIPDKEVFYNLLRISKNQIIFGGNFFAHLLPPATHWIFWDKGMTMPTYGDGELVWTSFPLKSIKKQYFQFNGMMSDSEDKREHPTQKPSELIGRLIREYSKQDEVIFDCFMGSGTTGLAAERIGRKWFGCELEPKYVDIANKRIEAERNQLKLF